VAIVEVDDVDADREMEGGRGGFTMGRFGRSGLGLPPTLLMAFSQSDGKVVVGLIADDTDTFSKESAMLMTSPSTLPSSPVILGDDRLRLGGCNSFPSEESDTE